MHGNRYVYSFSKYKHKAINSYNPSYLHMYILKEYISSTATLAKCSP